MNTGRATGFDTTVSTVRLSISRASTLVAMKAERIAVARKTVASPRSTNMRWSSRIVHALNGLQRTIRMVAAPATTSTIGWRIDSRKVLRVMARSCSKNDMVRLGRVLAAGGAVRTGGFCVRPQAPASEGVSGGASKRRAVHPLVSPRETCLSAPPRPRAPEPDGCKREERNGRIQRMKGRTSSNFHTVDPRTLQYRLSPWG